MKLRLRSLPLTFVYVLYPVVGIITRGMVLSISRNWIDAVWAAMGVLALFILLSKRKITLASRHRFILGLLVAILALAVWRFGYSSGYSHVTLIPILLEFKPFFYVGVSLMLIYAIGLPDRMQFIRHGVWLGIIIIGDILVESVLEGRITRPLGSGEINYDASLLLISLCMTLEYREIKRSWIIWILVGLLVTMSRTTLATTVIILILFSHYGLGAKLSFGVLASGAIVYSFLVRDLSLQLVSADRYWMWRSGIELFKENPLGSLIGFPLKEGLPVEIPPALDWLWRDQQQSWGLSGIHPFNYHSFWLRIAISWGIPITILIGLGLIFLSMRKRLTTLLRSLMVLVIIQGLTMGVFYLSNVSIPLILGIALGFSASGNLDASPR